MLPRAGLPGPTGRVTAVLGKTLETTLEWRQGGGPRKEKNLQTCSVAWERGVQEVHGSLPQTLKGCLTEEASDLGWSHWEMSGSGDSAGATLWAMSSLSADGGICMGRQRTLPWLGSGPATTHRVVTCHLLELGQNVTLPESCTEKSEDTKREWRGISIIFPLITCWIY